MKVSGLDVHKDNVLCAIYNGKKHTKVQEYETLTPCLRKLGEELQKEGVKQIAMESTGIYWIPVWNILESMGFELILVNPYQIKQMPGRKSDIKDAQWIAELLYKKMLRPSLVPCKKIRELRSYERKYNKLQRRITSVEQQTEHILEISNIGITSLVSNISGKSVRRIVKALIEGETRAEELEKLVHGRIRNKHKEKVRESLTGFMSEHHRFILEQLDEELELLETQAERYLSRMRKICEEEYSKEMQELESLPGVDEIAAMSLIAESGVDMKAFEDSGKFVGWIGFRPRNDESAGKYKSTAITKGNKYLRSLLVQVAWGAVRTKGSHFKEKYIRLAIRKSKKKAIIATARKIAVIIWHLLSNHEFYNPDLLPVYDPGKVMAKIKYHQKEQERLNSLISG